MMSTPHNISIHYYGKSKSKLTLVTTKNHMNIGSFNFGRISYMTFEIKKNTGLHVMARQRRASLSSLLIQGQKITETLQFCMCAAPGPRIQKPIWARIQPKI